MEQVHALMDKCDEHYSENLYFGAFRYLNSASQLIDKLEDKDLRENARGKGRHGDCLA
ncbi:hypothetical protein JCM14036_12490 [Desulfotomaculum defluvii]